LRKKEKVSALKVELPSADGRQGGPDARNLRE